jgi:hypothetical protein
LLLAYTEMAAVVLDHLKMVKHLFESVDTQGAYLSAMLGAAGDKSKSV